MAKTNWLGKTPTVEKLPNGQYRVSHWALVEEQMPVVDDEALANQIARAIRVVAVMTDTHKSDDE
jgi:hypothetical protein